MKKNRSSIPLIIALVIVGCLAAFCVFWALSMAGGRNNPPVTAEPNWDSPRTRELFMRVCGDCHSNETAWPWYSKIPPVSWLVMNDVMEGRAGFNVSEWGLGENNGEEAAAAFQGGEMPPLQFLLMHPEARLTPAERTQLLNGLLATFGGEGKEGGENEGEED